MTRLRLLVLALAAALAAGFLAAVLHRPGGHRPVALGTKPVSVRQTLSPRDAQFGDTVVATTDVAADRPVQLTARFAPYRVVSSSRSVRQDGGLRLTHVEQRLRCLAATCVPPRSSTTVRFPPLQVTYRGGSRSLPWPPLRIGSRIGSGDIRRALFRVPQPAPVVHSARPVAGWSLLALAVVLATAGAALLLRLWLPRRPAPSREPPPLERALAEATASAGAGAGRRRRALDALARELEPLDPPLSAESRVLAWAPPDPAADAIIDLTGRVREAVAP